MYDPEEPRDENNDAPPTEAVVGVGVSSVPFQSTSPVTPSATTFPLVVSSAMEVPITASAMPRVRHYRDASSSTVPEGVFMPVSTAVYDDPLPSSSSIGDETMFYTIPTRPLTSMGDSVQTGGNPIIIPTSADSFHEESSHHLRGLSDLGIGPSSGPSDSVGIESNKATSPRGNSSSGTNQVGTSVVVSSESGKQKLSISKVKLGCIREKLRELKALIPPPITPEVSHTAAALQVRWGMGIG